MLEPASHELLEICKLAHIKKLYVHRVVKVSEKIDIVEPYLQRQAVSEFKRWCWYFHISE